MFSQARLCSGVRLADGESQGGTLTGVFSRDSLAAALTAVSAAQTDTELGWILLDFSGNGQVIVTGVSHNLSIRYEFQADYQGQGTLRVSGKQLFDYVKQLPPEKISVRAELPYRVQLKCGRSSARIQLVQDQMTTEVLVPAIGTSVRVRGDVLERWIKTFRDFVAVDDIRFYANGALVWAEAAKEADAPARLNAIASDSLRLASSILLEGVGVEKIDGSQVLVSRKALDETRRVCTLHPEREFKVSWHQDSLFFAVETEGYTMLSRCIAGKYPPYAGAMPQSISNRIEVDLEALEESVRRVFLFADKNKVVRLDFDGPVLDVQSSTPGLKEGAELVDLPTPVTTPFSVSYNGTLLSGILAVISGGKVTLAWDNVNRPIRLSGEPERGLEVFYLLVPIRF